MIEAAYAEMAQYPTTPTESKHVKKIAKKKKKA